MQIIKETHRAHYIWGRRGRDRMVFGFTTTWTISAYQRISREFESRLWWCVLDTTLCDQACQWLAAGRWFSRDTAVCSTNKTDSLDIAKILLKVSLNTIASIALTPTKLIHVDTKYMSEKNKQFWNLLSLRILHMTVCILLFNTLKCSQLLYPSVQCPFDLICFPMYHIRSQIHKKIY
jgi:hypothetical protein